MAQSKSRLGRGLGSLISGGVSAAPKKSPAKKAKAPSKAEAAKTPPTSSTFQLVEISVSKVVSNPYQPRREFRQDQIMELAHSIRAEGLLQPVVVREKDGKFELIAGERRLRAFQFLKILKIPARIITASDASSAALALIENQQREGLNPIEEAYGFASLIGDFDLTQEEASERVGKGRATVANSLRLLNLDEKIQGYLAKGLISTGHAKVILGLSEPAEREMLAQRIIEQGMSVREAEKALKRLKDGSGGKHSQSGKSENAAVADLERKLASQLNTPVSLKHSAKKGKIVIEYFGNDDLQRVLERLGLSSE